SPNVTQTLDQRVPGVFISDAQGNEFTSDLRYRGFTASPLQGTPQGLAVYMQGIRVNEAFGDTVNWDLIPNIAIGRADVWTNNPAFGLNALGGAISFQMKDGFTYRGTEFDASGGSYGRVGGSLQYGVRNAEWGLYLAAQGLKDDGWRYQSPSRIARFYGDLGWKDTDAEVHLVASAADNFFGVIGPTPVELLNNDYQSIFTWPQTTRNQVQLLALNGRYDVTDHWIVQSNLYVRKFQQAHVDGNGAEVERCSGMLGNALFNTLCLENDGFPTQPQANFQILNPINQPPGDHIPGIPLHQIKSGVDYAVTPDLKLGTDLIWVSSQWYIGDQANQNVKLADYWVANLHGSYQLSKEVQLYGVVNNLFNRKFATFGTYFNPQVIANAIPDPPTDHRMVTPAQPLSIYVGLRAKL